jgi:hypothetical protein
MSLFWPASSTQGRQIKMNRASAVCGRASRGTSCPPAVVPAAEGGDSLPVVNRLATFRLRPAAFLEIFGFVKRSVLRVKL